MSVTTKLFTQAWDSYELLDAGGGKKLERFGSVTTIRPELQAYFKSDTTFVEWEKKADCAFIEKSTTKGLWKRRNTLEKDSWNIAYKDLKFKLELTSFKHVGIFPEQVINWDFLSANLDCLLSFALRPLLVELLDVSLRVSETPGINGFEESSIEIKLCLISYSFIAS